MFNEFVHKIKSSKRFGEVYVTKNIQELIKERRFLFFTKKGPIEVVFNIKHYLSAFFLTLFITFKILQFAFFGAINIFTNLMIYKNSIDKSSQFTSTEVEALKNIAEQAINREGNLLEREREEVSSEIYSKDIENENLFSNVKNFAMEKAYDLKSYFSNWNYTNLDDESIFDDFASLASPELVAVEHLEKNIEKSTNQKRINESNINIFEKKYSNLPVLPFPAPRNNKTKIIQFSKKVDLEIIELVNVFKSLKLKPDKISLEEVEAFLNNKELSPNDSALINQVSLRFQYLEMLKDAIIFLPLKPPMQYYYVSSPFGMRIHPKTKKKQMHKGIDMAGTWQEEVRASADGKVVFSGRNGSFGKTVKIRHRHGIETLYGHLHKNLVKKGDIVKEGQIIGKMGSTGRVVGAHLHYEILVNKKAINPYNFISIGRNLLSSSILKK
tara:strand:+ start:624 stop:1946 length:1323 start_codon:yes stop_codon:yes gene_type:complete